MSENEATTSRSTIRRAARVLDAFTTQPEWGVRQLASHLDAPKSGLHRTLQEMAATGLLRATEDGSYQIAPELLRLASGLLRATDVTRVAHDHLVRATEITGETSMLIAYDPERQQIIELESIDSPKPVQFRGALREWTDLHLSASGLGILAFLSPSEIERYFSHPRKNSEGKPVTIRSLQPDLDRIRNAGWAMTHGARIPGTSGVCSPVFDSREKIVGGVVIVWPHRPDPVDSNVFAETCRETAHAITAELGGHWGSDRVVVAE